MRCPKCGGKLTTYDSRPRMNNTNWRRKKCLVCGYRFSTVEMSTVELAKQTMR